MVFKCGPEAFVITFKPQFSISALILLSVVRIKHEALCLIGLCSTTELHPSPVSVSLAMEGDAVALTLHCVFEN